jgi:hypothetical protein
MVLSEDAEEGFVEYAAFVTRGDWHTQGVCDGRRHIQERRSGEKAARTDASSGEQHWNAPIQVVTAIVVAPRRATSPVVGKHEEESVWVGRYPCLVDQPAETRIEMTRRAEVRRRRPPKRMSRHVSVRPMEHEQAVRPVPQRWSGGVQDLRGVAPVECDVVKPDARRDRATEASEGPWEPRHPCSS